ncbi:MAG: phage holin family protein [Clostridium sp.]|nr:phage holin family protein [Clostridium sp.]
MDKFFALFHQALQNDIIQVLLLSIVMDTVFGIFRAIRQFKLNSSFGIDGVIRKVAMVAAISFLVILDAITDFNLIGFIPEEIRKHIGSRIGLAEFFGIIFIGFETVSILKNMVLCGLPVRGIWQKVRDFLGKYTDELPSDE